MSTEPPADAPAHTDAALDFHFREHASLRADIESDKDYLRRLQSFAVIGAGGIWSWLVVHPVAALRVGWFIPFVIGASGFVQTRGIVRDILARAQYLRVLEGAIPRLEGVQGWETFLHQKRRGSDPAIVDWIFWTVFLLVAATGPLVVFWLMDRT